MISTPTISSVSPSSGPAEGGTGVTIAGTDFRAGAVVSFGEIQAAITAHLSETSIGDRTAGDVGAVPVTVTNTDGASVTMAGGFVYHASDERRCTDSGPSADNTSVTISGSQFQSGAVVRFGALSATITSLTQTSSGADERARAGREIRRHGSRER